MAARVSIGSETAQGELARLLAEGYLRLLGKRARNSQLEAKLQSTDSSLTRCYPPPAEQ